MREWSVPVAVTAEFVGRFLASEAKRSDFVLFALLSSFFSFFCFFFNLRSFELLVCLSVCLFVFLSVQWVTEDYVFSYLISPYLKS